MPRFIFSFLLFLGLSVRVWGLDVEVVVTGVKTAEGVIHVGLFDSAETFPHSAPPYAVVRPAEAGKVLIKLVDIPVGAYAIAVFHDKNRDKVVNTNLFGVPLEPYGFSFNTPHPSLMPVFAESVQQVDKAHSHFVVALIHE